MQTQTDRQIGRQADRQADRQIKGDILIYIASVITQAHLKSQSKMSMSSFKYVGFSDLAASVWP